MKTISIFFTTLLLPAALFCQDMEPNFSPTDAWSEALHQPQTATDLSPPETTLGLEQWLDLALQNNLSIQAAGKEVGIAQERQNEARRAFMPTLSLGTDAQYYLKMPKQMLPASSFGGPEGAYNAAEMGVPLNISTYAQGRKVLFNRQLNIGREQAALGTKTAGLRQEQTSEEVIWQVSATYYQAQALHQQKILLEHNVASLDRLIEKARLLAQHTLARQSDVDKLLVQKVQLENDIANAADQFDASVRMLRYLVNTDSDEPFTVELTADGSMDFPTWAAKMSIRRTDMELLFRQQEGVALEQQSILAQRLPTAAAFSETGLTDFGKFGTGSFNEAHRYAAVGFQVSWNIFDGGIRRSKMEQKTLELQKLRLQQEQLDGNIRREVADAQSALQTQFGAISTQRQNMELAEKLFGQTELQFREGLVGIQEVIDRQNALTAAQTSYVNALIQFRLAELDLKKATGNLLTIN
jgi:outer membrane protein TolC